jgi:serine/threonine-protein kinase CTR1
VFSFGVLLWQIICQVEPFSFPPYDKFNGRGMAQDQRHLTLFVEIASFVIAGKRFEIPKETNQNIAALIAACWDQDPTNRPEFAQISKALDALAKSTSSSSRGLPVSLSAFESETIILAADIFWAN